MELGLSGKKINEVISLRSGKPYSLNFLSATLSISSPFAQTAELV